MKKLTNEENYSNYQKRKVLRYLVMVCASLTIVFVMCYYASGDYKNDNYTFLIIALVFFVLNIIFNKIRENTPINLSE